MHSNVLLTTMYFPLNSGKTVVHDYRLYANPDMWGCINLNIFNIVVAFLHLIQGCLTLYIALSKQDAEDWMFKGRFTLVDQSPKWYNGSFNPMVSGGFNYTGNDKYHISLETTSIGAFDVRWAVPSFFLMSFMFQIAASVIPSVFNDGTFTTWSSILRYLEYSVSGTLVLMCIAVECGVCQWMTLFCMAMLSFATMLLGLISDFMFILGSEQTRCRVNKEYQALNLWIWVLPHSLSWVSCVASYFPIMYTFMSSATTSDLKPPKFVYAIIITEAFLFFCFGIVQSFELYNSSMCVQEAAQLDKTGAAKKSDPVNTQDTNNAAAQQSHALSLPGESPLPLGMSPGEENTHKFAAFMYIILSMVAKTLLGWLIFGPILAGN